MKLKDLKDESGFILRGKIVIILLIIFAIGTIVGILIGYFSGDWSVSYLFGSLLLLNVIINLPILFINMIREAINRRKLK